MNPHEMNYHPREQELLAVVGCLKAWRPYLHGLNFKIRTDHKSLKYIETQPQISPRPARWLEHLLEFEFTIEHIKGKSRKSQTPSQESMDPKTKKIKFNNRDDVCQINSLLD